MSEPPSYSAMWKPGSSTSSSNTRNKPVAFQPPIQQKAPSYKAPSNEQVNPRAKKSYIKSIQDEETAKPLSIGASTHGMSKKVDWEVDETITLKEDYDLSQLLDSPCFKNLLKLSIQVSGFTEIPPTFFEHMPLLEELDLSTTNIQSLPSSISSLTLLQKLFLRGCSVLMELPSEIGMLTKLKLLDCEGSEIMYIPKEIGELNELEVLRVSLSQYADYFLKTKRVNDSVIIPRDILSKLNKLKELCITTCPEAEWWEEEVKEIQYDLCHLEYLETLKWYLPTKMLLDQFLQIKREGKKIYENLSNFTLTIGQHPQLTSCLPANLEKKFEKFEKCLKWINAEGNEKDISMIMERAEALFLSRHWTIVRLSDFDLSKLKYCLLAECNEMETLVKVDELSENFGKVGLESIEYLIVHDMEKFQCIWNGPMGKDSLSRLRILALHACPKLTTIFTINIAQNLLCLTELTVEDCPNVTSLISDESPNIAATGPLIPCLEKIFLLDLPDLDSTFRGKIILEKVDSLLVYNCLKLQYLSVTELPNIQKIKGEREWWNNLKCDKSRWQNVFEQLKEERKLIEQLAEATNSLQRFHDILSRDAKDEKPLDRSSLGVSETKGHASNFPIGKQEGLSLSQPGFAELLHISLAEIVEATNNFAEENLVNNDDFIINTYKGQLLLDGELITITARKVIYGEAEFWKEIRVLSSLRHKHIVSNIGYSKEKGENIIINKHEVNGSMYEHLLHNTMITWIQRLKISVGIAHGLSYIHYDEGHDLSIIHGNIKSSTILLDENWEAKLSGFQLSMIIPVDKRHRAHNSKIYGTPEYTDPVCIETGTVSHKSDVYSLGIVLFEILSGRLAGHSLLRHERLNEIAKYHYENGKLDDFIDPNLLPQMDIQSFELFSKIAYSCLNQHPSQRPNILRIVRVLEKALEHQQKHENPSIPCIAAVEVEDTSYRSFGDAKDVKPLDRSSLGVSETKGHTSNFPIGKQEGLSLSQPDAKDEKPLDRSNLGVSETKGHTSNFIIGPGQ